MSPGAETNLSRVYVTRTISSDYVSFCKIDVLGLEDMNRWCIANSKCNWCVTLRGDTRLVYCGKLDIQHSLTIAPLTNLTKKLQKVPSHLNE